MCGTVLVSQCHMASWFLGGPTTVVNVCMAWKQPTIIGVLLKDIQDKGWIGFICFWHYSQVFDIHLVVSWPPLTASSRAQLPDRQFIYKLLTLVTTLKHWTIEIYRNIISICPSPHLTKSHCTPREWRTTARKGNWCFYFAAVTVSSSRRSLDLLTKISRKSLDVWISMNWKLRQIQIHYNFCLLESAHTSCT